MPSDMPDSGDITPDYGDKPKGYFDNPRRDIVAMMGADPAAWVLEVGCGGGATGAAALAAGKAGRYVGVELPGPAAEAAKGRLSEVLVGNVDRLDLSGFSGRFDALILSEVLEHLVDPWTTLKRLSDCLKPGARVFASTPNIAHHRVIRGLLAGRFEYAPSGVMDRTHLRWFTPTSFRRLFEEAGIAVDALRPLGKPRWYAVVLDRLSGGYAAHLFTEQIMVIGRKPDSTASRV